MIGVCRVALEKCISSNLSFHLYVTGVVRSAAEAEAADDDDADARAIVTRLSLPRHVNDKM